MAMTDYPTKAHFLEKMPANPVDKACEKLAGIPELAPPTSVEDKLTVGTAMTTRAKLVLAGMKEASEIYFNYQKKIPSCSNFKITDPAGDLGGTSGWDALACNEIDMPQASDGVHDMFYPQPAFSFTGDTSEIYKNLITFSLLQDQLV